MVRRSAIQYHGVSLICIHHHSQYIVGSKVPRIILWIAGDIIEGIGNELIRIRRVNMDQASRDLYAQEVLLRYLRVPPQRSNAERLKIAGGRAAGAIDPEPGGGIVG